jgi:predicted DsbA family dithiol-disulfide isomerase
MSLAIDIWSDIACPWCYVGKRRLERALAAFEHPVAIRWHAFELNPSAPRVVDPAQSYAARLAAKYRVGVREAAAMIDRMTSLAADEGLAFRFDIIRPGNTFDAHRLLAFAAEHGCQSDLKERLLRAYLCEGAAIGDRDVLAALAAEVGLDGASVLAGDRFAAEVRADELQARELEITGVPFFVIDRCHAVSGAQSTDVLLDALERAWSTQMTVAPAGAACGPDLCS